MSDGTGSYPRRERFLSNLNRPNQDIGNSVTTLAGNRATDNFILVKNATKDGYLKATEGDGVDISTRMQHHRGTVQKKSCQTITCMGGENVGVVVDDRNLKEQLCDKLIESGEVKPGDIVKHSYTTQILEGKKKGVEKNGEMITLTTRPDCVGVVVDSPANFEKNLTIRKLTPLECLKLMGFDDKDYAKLREIGQTDMQIYHEAGDSIVVTVLMSIFGQLLGIDYEPIVEKYVKSLKTTTCSK